MSSLGFTIDSLVVNIEFLLDFIFNRLMEIFYFIKEIYSMPTDFCCLHCRSRNKMKYRNAFHQEYTKKTSFSKRKILHFEILRTMIH